MNVDIFHFLAKWESKGRDVLGPDEPGRLHGVGCVDPQRQRERLHAGSFVPFLILS